MGPVSIGVEVQRNTDGDTPSIKLHAARASDELSWRDTKKVPVPVNVLPVFSGVFIINVYERTFYMCLL